MINIFKNKTNNQYKTATLIREDRSQYSFKYKKITQRDIEKLNIFPGMRTQFEEFIIATTDQFDFTILNLSVNIEGYRYKILDSYTEDNMHGEGQFRKADLITTYLRIGK